MKELTSKMMFAALGTLMLAACNNEEITPGMETWSDTPQFSATIKGAGEATTRAFDTQWDANDQIGISGTSGDVTYTNVPYMTTNGNGIFEPVPQGDVIYYQTDEAVNFTAYYPWNDLQNRATTIAADTWGQSDQKDFDFLWAQKSGSKQNPKVDFHFVHKMSKLELTIKTGDGVSFDEVKAAVLMLEGFKHKGSFDVTNGTTTVTDEGSGLWAFANNTGDTDYNAPCATNDKDETLTYTLILFPQAFETALPFTATLTGEQSFTANLDFTKANAGIDKENAKNEWVAGRQYNLGIVLNKTGIEVKGCTIASWEEVPGGDFSAE